MDFSRLKKAAEESGTIQPEEMRDRGRTQIVAPTVTRRPVLDSMLANISAIAQAELERMRLKATDYRVGLNADELRSFKNLAETTIRQARVEMEVENHVQARTSALSMEQIRDKLLRAMATEGVDQRTQGIVLKALGMKA